MNFDTLRNLKKQNAGMLADENVRIDCVGAAPQNQNTNSPVLSLYISYRSNIKRIHLDWLC